MLRNARRAVALMEAIVALAILGFALVGYLVHAQNAAAAVERAHEAEARLLSASSFLDAVSLWTAPDLDRRLGYRRQGPWLLHVERREELYFVRLMDSTATATLLATVLYRRSAPAGSP